MTYVYKHTFPNGKIYIGIADNYFNRWNNGRGYSDNQPMYAAIKEYGWDNIKHEILKKCESRQEAEQLEQRLIIAYRSEDSTIGYNRTRYLDNLVKLEPITIKSDTRQKNSKEKTIKTNCEKTVFHCDRVDKDKLEFIDKFEDGHHIGVKCPFNDVNGEFVGIHFNNGYGVTTNKNVAKWLYAFGYEIEVSE